MSKSNIKLVVGLSIAAAATTVLVIGVIRELKAIRNLTIDIDELPEEPGDIADPWYTGDFDIAYRQIEQGCRALLQQLTK